MPYINITPSEKGDNKGSSRELVNYLEKENQTDHPAAEQKKEKEMWFDQFRSNIEPEEVQSRIDKNTGKLKQSEAKFFLLNISPSEKELAHIGNDPEKLKEYAKGVMEVYAQNFQKGINADNLLYFGKIEHNRTYSYKDLEVQRGEAARGDLKPGLQTHVQIIVSRKDNENKRLLSPLNNSKGKNLEHSAKFGQFNQINFKEASEKAFDRQFSYERDFTEQFRYVNTMKNGKVYDKALLSIEKEEFEQNKSVKEQQKGMEKELQADLKLEIKLNRGPQLER